MCVPHFVGFVEANHIFVILMSCIRSHHCCTVFFSLLSPPVVHNNVLPQLMHPIIFHFVRRLCMRECCFFYFCLLVNKLKIYLKLLLQFYYYTYLFDLHCDVAFVFSTTNVSTLLFICGHFVMKIILLFIFSEFACILLHIQL